MNGARPILTQMTMWRTFLLNLWLVRSGPNLSGCYFITMCDGPAGEEYDKSEMIRTSAFYFELISQHFPMGFVGLYCKELKFMHDLGERDL